MVSLQECLDLSGLDEEAVQIIARHRHVPDIVAAEMGFTLSQTPEGVRQLRRLIRDDLKRAARDGDLQRSLRLNRVLAQFNARYRAPALRA